MKLVAVWLLVCVGLSGCRHSPAAASGMIHLQDLAGYPLLVPDGAAGGAGLMQETTVRLGAVRPDCFIDGTVFSLRPPATGDVWTMRSPSEHGWHDAAMTGDFREAWLGFERALSAREQLGCFPATKSALRLIAEAITVPADEAVLFRYAFTGRGATDLLPGMVVEAEHSYLRPNKVGKRELTSAVARYHVVYAGRGGVALRRTFVENEKLAGEQSALFHLDRATAGAAHIRLFLQGMTEGSAQHTSLLLSGSDASALDRVSRAVEAAGAMDCKAAQDAAVQCLAVEAAVSLLIECRLDGKTVVQPMGTSLNQLLWDRTQDVPSARIKRRLSDGNWREVEFPHTAEAAGRVVLLDGDEVTTR